MNTEQYIKICRNIGISLIFCVVGSCFYDTESQVNEYQEIEALLPQIVSATDLRPEDVSYLGERNKIVIYLLKGESEAHGLLFIKINGDWQIISRSTDRSVIEQWVNKEKFYIKIRKVLSESYSVNITGNLYILKREGLRPVVSYPGI